MSTTSTTRRPPSKPSSAVCRALAPAEAGQPFGLLGEQHVAGGEHQHVVAELAAVDQPHPVALEIHPVHRAAAIGDPFAQPRGPGADEVLATAHPERHEQQARLVDVVVVLVDDGDLQVRAGAPQPVRGQSATRAAAEDHDPRCHGFSVRRMVGRRSDAIVSAGRDLVGPWTLVVIPPRGLK
jgi:hypothetical protein